MQPSFHVRRLVGHLKPIKFTIMGWILNVSSIFVLSLYEIDQITKM